MRIQGRRAFTIVEMLVVITIIGMLIGLLLPAIGAARERARGSQCKNNLKQISTAIKSYMAVQTMLPISVSPWAEGQNPYPERSGKGWITGILSNLEFNLSLNKDLVSQGDFHSGGGLRDPNQKNLDAIGFHIPQLSCPSDGGTAAYIPYPGQGFHPEFPMIRAATTNYKGVSGDHQLSYNGGTLAPSPSIFLGTTPDMTASNPCNGLFWRNSYQFPKRFERFSDGTSNTFMVGEDLPIYNSNSVWCFADGDWASCNIPLNYKPEPPTPTDWVNVMSFRSNHQGGAHFAFADEQVRFINEDIYMRVYRALSTRDNHKVEGPTPNLNEL
jgi:prepilin-type N-terminal cleavage/methylation domain-containing protein